MSSNLDRDFYTKKIRELDPKEEFVAIDLDHEEIKYHSDIEYGRSPKFEDEEFCRAYLVAWLCTKAGYLPENLYLERQYTIGRPGGTSAWGDILVRRDSDIPQPYMVIEVKTPSDYDEDKEETIKGQLFDVALQEPGVSVLAYASVARAGDHLDIQCMVIDYARYASFEAWIDHGRPKASTLPVQFGRPVTEPLKKGGDHDLRTDASVEEFDRIWRRLHDLLWGGHLDDNDVFEWVTRMFLAKIFDEKTTKDSDEYNFQVKYQAGALEDVETTFERMDRLYRAAIARYLEPGADPESIRGIDRNVFGPTHVRNVVEQLQEFSILPLGNSQSRDLLSRFFGQVIREGFKQSKGLYLTNPNIVFFMLHALDLEGLVKQKLQCTAPVDSRAPYIIDPACGSGTFLLAAFQLTQRFVSDNRAELTDTIDTEEAINTLFSSGGAWAHTHLYGLDPHRSLPIAAKVNMILHGDGSGHIFHKGGLLPFNQYVQVDDQRRLEPTGAPSDPNYGYPLSESFDVVVSNPPFSIELSNGEKASLRSTFRFSAKTKSENLFFERWYQLLRPGGRLGVVLPESFFSVAENSYIRQFLFKYFIIRAIVHLPDTAFHPYTSTLTTLLFAQKKTSSQVEEWNMTWEQKRSDVEREIAQLRRGLHKREWPDEGASTQERKSWLTDRIESCRAYLTEGEYYELLSYEDLKETMRRLRYILDRSKGSRLPEFILPLVSEELDYQIPSITVENIGYKQTKRSIHLRPNEFLKAVDQTGMTVSHIENVDTLFDLRIDTDNPSTALDWIKGEVKWD